MEQESLCGGTFKKQLALSLVNYLLLDKYQLAFRKFATWHRITKSIICILFKLDDYFLLLTVFYIMLFKQHFDIISGTLTQYKKDVT